MFSGDKETEHWPKMGNTNTLHTLSYEANTRRLFKFRIKNSVVNIDINIVPKRG